MKKLIALLMALALICTSVACSGGSADNGQSSNTDSDADSSDSAAGGADITLGDTITVNGSGAKVEGRVVTITSAGSYNVSGTSDDAQLIVYTEDKETVRLVLNGVDITCPTSAPIYVVNAEKVVINLADGTENYVTDGASYKDVKSDEPDAAVFSNDDLTINGNGSLTIDANYNNGIQSKDDLKITGGTITVNAVNDGVKGRDSITVKGGAITVNAGGDGMQSNNDENSTKGYISIEGGTINIVAGADGLQAETSVNISSGDVKISTGGGSAKSAATSDSAKGIKAAVSITIGGGTVNIDSADDSVNSNGNLTITGGNIVASSGDDGMHANSAIEINGGDIRITKCYEGLESAVVTINDGSIHIVSSDDGINIVGGVDGSSINGRPGQNTFESSGNNHLYINGGYLVIDANGDGIDVNGPIDMTGGIVIINGPTRDDNGALDYLNAFKMTGGYLIAVGSAGMAQAPSATSTMYAVNLFLSSVQAAGIMVHIETQGGEDVLTFVTTKAYQSVVLCSTELAKGTTYAVYSGGSSTGTVTDGLYSGGTYTAGTQVTTFTISSIVTTVGSYSGGPGGGMPPGGGGRR